MPGKYRLYMHCPGLCEDQLYPYLQHFGRVTDVYLPTNLDGSSKGYGFASFEAAEGLSAALAAGDEHVIEGKTVRVNRAGPRPAPHIGVTSAANRQPAQCDTSAPLPSGISRQRGGHAVPALLGSTSVLSERVTEAQGTADASRPRAGAGAIQGAGPRIYVGGIPTAVSETMVKNYFSNWGKVEDVYFPKEKSSGRRRPFCFVTLASQKAAEKAVAQSNREISGYQIASICMTADRVAHYQQVAAGRPEGQPLPDALDQPVPTPASTYEALMQRLSSGVEMGGLPAGTDHQFANHQRALLGLTQQDTPGAPVGLAAQLSHPEDNLSALHPLLLGHAMQGQPGMQPPLQPPLLVGAQHLPPQQGSAQTHLHEALLANMARADLTNPAFLPFTFPGTQSAQGINPLTFNHTNQLQALLLLQQQQQGLSPVPQSSAGHQQVDPGPGRQGGSMPDYLGAPQSRLQQQQQPGLDLAYALGQQQVTRHEQLQQQLTPQNMLAPVFNPIVRRPGQNSIEALPVFQVPQVEPALSQQTLTFNHAYGSSRGSPQFHAPGSAPF